MKDKVVFLFSTDKNDCPHCSEKTECVTGTINDLINKGNLNIQYLLNALDELYESAYANGKRDSLEKIIQYATDTIEEEE